MAINLVFPALRYQVRSFYGPGMASSEEEREGHIADTIRTTADRLAIIAMHCWNIGEPDGPYPYEPTDEPVVDSIVATWVPRARRIIKEQLVPLFAAARQAGIWICHSAPNIYGVRYPQHKDELDQLPVARPATGGESPKPYGCLNPLTLKQRYAKSYGPSFPGAVWETHPDMFDIARAIRPQAEDGVIITTQQLDRLLRRRGVDTLLYVGFMTDYCIMGSPGGIESMTGLGYRCIILRDCTTAFEYADTIATNMMTKAAIRRIEYAFGWSGTSADIIKACRADVAETAAEDVNAAAMWRKFGRAQELIPGGSVTMSKVPARDRQPHTPALIVRGKGCRVWDAAGRCFIDFRNALGPITLGYGNEQVNAAIRRQLENGIVFGHPSPLEVELAERLVRLIPCAEQVRYLKTGGEAMAAAIRMARAFTGRPVVLSTGYHGWINNTSGGRVGNPPEFGRLGRFLPWGDIKAFEEAVSEVGEDRVAALTAAMPYADIYPGHPFFGQLRALADKISALLIFDEIVTGFRVRIGGVQEYFGITPDLAVFSKGVAAGMPLSVVCGRAEVMKHAATIPISSTFAGETLSLASALETVGIYENQGVIEHIWARGEQLVKGLNEIFHHYSFPIEVKGLPACATWSIGGENWNVVGEKHSAAAQNVMDAFIDACYAHGVSLYTVLYPNFAHSAADIDEALTRIDLAVKELVDNGTLAQLA